MTKPASIEEERKHVCSGLFWRYDPTSSMVKVSVQQRGRVKAAHVLAWNAHLMKLMGSLDGKRRKANENVKFIDLLSALRYHFWKKG